MNTLIIYQGHPFALYYTKYNTNLTINQPLNNVMQNMKITRIISNIFLVLQGCLVRVEMIDFVCLYTTNVKLSIHQALQGSGIFAPSLQTLTNGMKFLLGTLVLAPWPILVVTFIPFCQDKPFSHAILCVPQQNNSQAKISFSPPFDHARHALTSYTSHN